MRLALPAFTLRTRLFPKITLSSYKIKRMSHLVWVDLEMTGLDIDKETILEMACIITDANLKVIAEGPDLCIHHSDQALDNMDEWCRINHAKSGLTARVKESMHTLQEVEKIMLDFVKLHVPTAGVAPLAGNSIHVDRMFLDKYMPNFNSHLHYRIMDVSTVKEMCRRWYPEQFAKAPLKQGKHRALEGILVFFFLEYKRSLFTVRDIKESIEEMQYYRASIFK